MPATLLLILAMAGCSRQTQAPVASEDPEPTAAAENQPVDMTTAVDPTNALLTAQAVARALQASPFASANPALKMSYTRALTAQVKSNYAAAFAELQALAREPGLTPQQTEAVRQLLASLKSAAPELGATPTEPAQGPGPVFPLAQEGGAPFSTADPAVAELFGAAELALKIGDFNRALEDLQSLSTNAQLNWQQQDAVRQLLSRIPQSLPNNP